MSHPIYPAWVVLHIPHDSTTIPDPVRSQFLLSDQDLDRELQRMTDQFTHALFAEPLGEASVIRAPVSRLVVDVERFAKDDQEPMAARGMGVIYEVTSHLTPLRRQLSPEEREVLMRTWYYPHHDRLACHQPDVTGAKNLQIRHMSQNTSHFLPICSKLSAKWHFRRTP